MFELAPGRHRAVRASRLQRLGSGARDRLLWQRQSPQHIRAGRQEHLYPLAVHLLRLAAGQVLHQRHRRPLTLSGGARLVPDHQAVAAQPWHTGHRHHAQVREHRRRDLAVAKPIIGPVNPKHHHRGLPVSEKALGFYPIQEAGLG